MNPSFGRIVIVCAMALLVSTACSSQTQTPTLLSWPEQVQFATEAAQQIDPAAVLDTVGARLDQPPAVEAPLALTFAFARPKGAYIELYFLDTDPPTIQRIEPDNGRGEVDDSIREQERLRAALATVNIGPREAIRATQVQGEAFVAEQGSLFNPRVELFMGKSVQKLVGLPAVWVVYYVGDTETLHISVNPTTGEVLAVADDFLELFGAEQPASTP